MENRRTHLAFWIVAKFLLAVAVVGLFIMFFRPVRTVGVFLTILLFELAPALPAAAASTDRCASCPILLAR